VNRALTTILGRRCVEKATFKKRFVYFCLRRAESESGADSYIINTQKSTGAETNKFSETSIKQNMLRIQPRLALINGILLAKRVKNISFTGTRSLCTTST
jgi:hypothetical protein